MNAIDDTIGGTATDVTDTTGANTIGFNLQHGVNVMSGVGNTISRNFYTSNDGSAMTALVNDIANSNQTAPILGNPNPLGYDSTANTTQVRLSVTVPNTSLPVGLEFYLVGVNERVYLGATTPAVLNGTKTITFTAQGDVTLGESIAATATTSNGTSSFSGSVTLTSACGVQSQ